MRKIYSAVLAVSCGIIFMQNGWAETNSSGDLTVTTTVQKDTNMPVQQNQMNGEKFLNENKTKQGVVTLPSGLQYKVIEAGTGPKPTATSKVTVDYEGTLVDGTVFDSSYKRGEPISFPVNGVIPGWTEALKLMPEGSTWMLYIPANLAYGARGAGPTIGPNSTLVFKVHLISVK